MQKMNKLNEKRMIRNILVIFRMEILLQFLL